MYFLQAIWILGANYASAGTAYWSVNTNQCRTCPYGNSGYGLNIQSAKTAITTRCYFISGTTWYSNAQSTCKAQSGYVSSASADLMEVR